MNVYLKLVTYLNTFCSFEMILRIWNLCQLPRNCINNKCAYKTYMYIVLSLNNASWDEYFVALSHIFLTHQSEWNTWRWCNTADKPSVAHCFSHNPFQRSQCMGRYCPYRDTVPRGDGKKSHVHFDDLMKLHIRYYLCKVWYFTWKTLGAETRNARADDRVAANMPA